MSGTRSTFRQQAMKLCAFNHAILASGWCIALVTISSPTVLAVAELDRLYRMGDDPAEPASNGAAVVLALDSIGTVFADGDLQDLAPTGSPTYVDISSDRPLPVDTTNTFAVNFDGVGDFVSGDPLVAPNTTASNVNASSPILGNYDGLFNRGYQFWAKPDAGGIGSFQQVVSDGDRFVVSINEAGEWTSGYSGSVVSSDVVASTNEWTHLMHIRPFDPAGGARFYVNGLAVVTQPGGYNTTPDGNLVVGANSNGTGDFYDGLVDELEMFVLGDNGIVAAEFSYATDNDYFTEVFLPSASAPGYSVGEAWIVGDADFDGDVDDDDVANFLGGWLSSNAEAIPGDGESAGDYLSIMDGDFDVDGDTDRRDFFLLREAYLAAHGSVLAVSFPVPEPSGLCLVGVAAVAIGVRRSLRAWRWSKGLTLALLTLVSSLLISSNASAQVVVTNDAQVDPSNVFLSNTTPLGAFTTMFEGDADTAAQGRGSTFLAPDTGDANNGWGLNEITVRWDDNDDRYPADLGFRVSVVQWPSLDPEDFSVQPAGGQLPGSLVYQQTGTLPALTPQTNLFDGDRLRFALDSTVFLQENVPYGFILDFDPATGTKDNETLRLEITSATGVEPGHLWATTLDAQTGDVLTSGSNAGQDLVFYLGGSPAIDTAVLPVLTIDRDSGSMSLRNDTAESYTIISYDFQAADGRFDQAGWTTIEAQGIDVDDTWLKFTDPTSVKDLAEGTFGELTVSPATEIDFGNAWERSLFEDVVLTLQDINGNEIVPVVTYVGNGGSAFVRGDFNLNGTVDAADWAVLRGNLFADVSALDVFDQYFQGDMNNSGVIDVDDFAEFKVAFEAENGVGSFAALTGSVPEPRSSVLLSAFALGAIVVVRRRKVHFVGLLAVVAASGLLLAPSSNAQNLVTNGEFVTTFTGTPVASWFARPQDKVPFAEPGTNAAPITWNTPADGFTGGLPNGETLTLPGWDGVNNVGQGAILENSVSYPSSQSDSDDLNTVAVIRWNDDAYFTQTISAASLLPNTTYTLSADFTVRFGDDALWASTLRDAALIGIFEAGTEAAAVDFSGVATKPIHTDDPLDNFSAEYTTGAVPVDIEVRLGSRDAGVGGGGDQFAFDNVELKVVPEPTSVAMLLMATCGCLFYRSLR